MWRWNLFGRMQRPPPVGSTQRPRNQMTHCPAAFPESAMERLTCSFPRTNRPACWLRDTSRNPSIEPPMDMSFPSTTALPVPASIMTATR